MQKHIASATLATLEQEADAEVLSRLDVGSYRFAVTRDFDSPTLAYRYYISTNDGFSARSFTREAVLGYLQSCPDTKDEGTHDLALNGDGSAEYDAYLDHRFTPSAAEY